MKIKIKVSPIPNKITQNLCSFLELIKLHSNHVQSPIWAKHTEAKLKCRNQHYSSIHFQKIHPKYCSEFVPRFNIFALKPKYHRHPSSHFVIVEISITVLCIASPNTVLSMFPNSIYLHSSPNNNLNLWKSKIQYNLFWQQKKENTFVVSILPVIFKSALTPQIEQSFLNLEIIITLLQYRNTFQEKKHSNNCNEIIPRFKLFEHRLQFK